MAEVFGAVSGAVGVVGVTGQAISGVIKLRDFLKDITGAPQRVRDIVKELDLMQSLLVDIEKSSSIQPSKDSSNRNNISAVLEQAINHCKASIDAIDASITVNNPNQHGQKVKRYWGQFRAAFQKADVDKLLDDLERSKVMLLQAHASTTGAEQAALLRDITPSLDQLATAQQANHALTTDLVNATLEESRSISLLASEIVRISTETRAATEEAARQNSLVLQTMTNQLNHVAQSLLIETSQASPRALMEIAQYGTEESIARRITQYTRESQGAFPAKTSVIRKGVDLQPGEDAQSMTAARPGAPAAQGVTKLGRGPEQSLVSHKESTASRPSEVADGQWEVGPAQQIRNTVFRNRLFGTLSVQTSTVVYFRQRGPGPGNGENEPSTDSKQVTTTQIFLLPAPWMRLRGVALHHQTRLFAMAGFTQLSQPEYNLRVVNVRPLRSEIFIACANLKVQKVRDLFHSGRASPYDVTDEGLDLLSLVFGGWMCARFSHNLMLDMEVLADMLIDMGLDPASQNSLGISALSYCFRAPATRLRFRYVIDKYMRVFRASSLLGVSDILVYNASQVVCPTDKNLALRQRSVSCITWYLKPREWYMPWSPLQLLVVSIPTPVAFRVVTSSARLYEEVNVLHWVAGTFGKIVHELKLTLTFLKAFQKAHHIYRHKHHVMSRLALYFGVRISGVYFAILATEKDPETGKEIWVRQRSRKTLLLKSWLRQIFKLIFHYMHQPTLSTLSFDELVPETTEHGELEVIALLREAFTSNFRPEGNHQDSLAQQQRHQDRGSKNTIRQEAEKLEPSSSTIARESLTDTEGVGASETIGELPIATARDSGDTNPRMADAAYAQLNRKAWETDAKFFCDCRKKDSGAETKGLRYGYDANYDYVFWRSRYAGLFDKRRQELDNWESLGFDKLKGTGCADVMLGKGGQ